MFEKKSAHAVFDALFAADATAFDLHEQLRSWPDPAEVTAIAVQSLDAEISASPLSNEAGLRVERLLEICGEDPCAQTTEAMLRALGSEDVRVRDAASEAVLARTYERYAEVARYVEKRSDTLAPLALVELCAVFVEIGEPSTLSLLRTLLAHQDPKVVAAAIEGLSEHGDPNAVSALEALEPDTRQVTLEDEDDSFDATIGELAREARSQLRKVATAS